MRRAAVCAHDTLLQLARARDSGALKELRAATAVAGPLPEVARVLAEVEASGQGVAEPGSAATGSPARVAAAAAAPAAVAAAAMAAAVAPAPTAAPARVCAACGAAGAALVCSGCRGVRYCGAECQKRDWGAHKAACRLQRQRQQEGAAVATAQQQQ